MLLNDALTGPARLLKTSQQRRNANCGFYLQDRPTNPDVQYNRTLGNKTLRGKKKFADFKKNMETETPQARFQTPTSIFSLRNHGTTFVIERLA